MDGQTRIKTNILPSDLSDDCEINYANKVAKLSNNTNSESRKISNYKRSLLELDKDLKTIIDYANPEDNIILFSDHGSNLFRGIKLPKLKADYSDFFATLEYLWRPTLLVSSPTLEVGPCKDDSLLGADLYCYTCFVR